MTRKVGVWLILAVTFCQGCSPVANSVRTLICEPYEYCRRFVSWTEIQKDADLAEASYGEYVGHHPEKALSEDFAKGYKYGFVDYLFAGGTGNPPPLPPRCYWGSKYESPEGHAMIEDWFAGFRAGAMTAINSGLRQSAVLVPSSTSLPVRPPQMFAGGSAAPGNELPQPKEIPGGTPPKEAPRDSGAPSDPLKKKQSTLPPSDVPPGAPKPGTPSGQASLSSTPSWNRAEVPASLVPASLGTAEPRTTAANDNAAGQPCIVLPGLQEHPAALSQPGVMTPAAPLSGSNPEPTAAPANPPIFLPPPAAAPIMLPQSAKTVSTSSTAEQRIVLPGPPEPASTSSTPTAEQRIVLPGPPEPASTLSTPTAEQRIVLPGPPAPLSTSSTPTAEQRLVLPGPPEPVSLPREP